MTMQQYRKGKSKSKKTQFTACQRQGLEKTFNKTQYISPVKRHLLSQTLGISEETIQVCMYTKKGLKTFNINSNDLFQRVTRCGAANQKFNLF